MAEKYSITRIQLNITAKDRLDKICSKRGATQIEVMSRLIGWFVRQDDVIQTAVMETLSDESMSKLAKQLLKSLAKGR